MNTERIKISFQKEPVATKRQAVLGQHRVNARTAKGGHKMSTHTTARRRSTFVAQTTVVPLVRQSDQKNIGPMISEQEVAEKFARVTLAYSKDDLSAVSGCTTEAAKHWKRKSRAPNTASMINIGRRLRCVRDWLVDELDTPIAEAGENPHDTAKTVMLGLQLASNMPGQQGAMARALLKKMLEDG